MSDGNRELDSEIESALLDAELFVKYQSPDRAIKRLRGTLERSPRSVELRERIREIATTSKQNEEAARQCLALASLYIEREDFDRAHDRLLEAKQLDPRISIASGLEAIRRARRPELQHQPVEHPTQAGPLETRRSTLSGDLSAISIFDIVQVLENAKLTGAMIISSQKDGRILFNEGRIVGAETEGTSGEEGFRKLVEVTEGTFEFERSTEAFPTTINALSNTNLILDSLRQLDEEKM